MNQQIYISAPGKKQRLTARMKLLPDDTATTHLLHIMEQYMAACNQVALYAYIHRQTSQTILYGILYMGLKRRYGLRGWMVWLAVRAVAADYKKMIAKKQWSKICYDQPLCSWAHRQGYRITGNTVSLVTVAGKVEVPIETSGWEQYLNDTCKLGAARIVHKGENWFLDVPLTKRTHKATLADTPCMVGMDLGINNLVAAYDSNDVTVFFRDVAVKRRRQKFHDKQARLEQKKPMGASLWLAALANRERRWMHRINQGIAKTLVSCYPPGTVFILEDLSIGNVVPNGCFYPYEHWAYADLRARIEYMAVKRGSGVVIIDSRYTSQTCPKCGYQSKANRSRWMHRFKCRKCGFATNDDRAAAMVIHRIGAGKIQEEKCYLRDGKTTRFSGDVQYSVSHASQRKDNSNDE